MVLRFLILLNRLRYINIFLLYGEYSASESASEFASTCELLFVNGAKLL